MFLRGAGLSPAFCARLDSQALCLPCLKAGNCHNPYPDTVENGTTLRKSGIHDTQFDYPDTVENGTTLRKSGIHDTQFDAKAPKPTPKNRKIDALQNSRSGRLCRPL